MKGHRQVLLFATAVLALPLAAFTQNTTSSDFTQADQHEAALMKPANAILVTSLDGAKDQSGSAVSAKLEDKVNLNNGTELPKGTMLLGKVTTDDMQQQGTKKLALRFDQARLKNGTTVPIRATIVGFYGPAAGDINSPEGGVARNNDWTSSTLEFDQEGVASGVDLHSKIDSQNSGVFVSTKKDDVRLRRGSEVQFAIAAANGGQNGMSAGGQN